MEYSTAEEFAKSVEDELINYTGEYEDEKMHKELCSVEAEHSDTTECSSSFDGSDCGDEWGEAQVLSDFNGAVESPSRNLFTKRKKLSSHWRTFIHPLMWRCQWVELQIKKLDAQARAYAHNNNASSEVLRRKRRRRAEATNDVAAYMSRHNLFSYYEHRKYIREISHNVLKNNSADRREEAKSNGELGNDEAEGGDCDKDLEDILGKVEGLHWRVVKLKSLVDDIVVEDEEDWSSLIWHKSPLDLPWSPTTTYHRMPVGTYVASQLLAEYNLGGVLLPENTDHPPCTTHAYQNEGKDDDDDVLIDNHRVREELPYFDKGNIDSITSRAEPPQPQAQAPSAFNLTNATKT